MLLIQLVGCGTSPPVQDWANSFIMALPAQPSPGDRNRHSPGANTEPSSHLSTHDDEVCVCPQPVQEHLDGEKQPLVGHDLQLLLEGSLVPAGFVT